MAYLSNDQISEMAQCAVTTYEVTGDWKAATRAAAEYSGDEFGIAPRKSAVLLAVKMAAVSWEAVKLQTRNAIAAE